MGSLADTSLSEHEKGKMTVTGLDSEVASKGQHIEVAEGGRNKAVTADPLVRLIPIYHSMHLHIAIDLEKRRQSPVYISRLCQRFHRQFLQWRHGSDYSTCGHGIPRHSEQGY